MQYARALVLSYCVSFCSALIIDRTFSGSHEMTAVFPGVIFRYNQVQSNRGDFSFLQQIKNTFFTSPCRSPFTSRCLELGNVPISKPIIGNEIRPLGFIKTNQDLPLDLRLGVIPKQTILASAGNDKSKNVVGR